MSAISGQRLDQWLTAHLPDVSRVRVQQLIEHSQPAAATGLAALPK